jgi:hypothetical protein
MNAGTLSGLLGGGVALIVALVAFIRSIIRQISSTEANTAAIEALTRKLDVITSTQTSHGERLASLEATRRRDRG